MKKAFIINLFILVSFLCFSENDAKAFDPGLVWSKIFSNKFYSDIACDGKNLFAIRNGKNVDVLHSFHLQTGRERIIYLEGEACYSDPCMILSDNKLIICSSYLGYVDPNNYQFDLIIQLEDVIHKAVLDNEILFFCTQKNMYSFDTETGNILRSQTFPAFKEYDRIESMKLSDNTIFIAGITHLGAFKKEDGTVIWFNRYPGTGNMGTGDKGNELYFEDGMILDDHSVYITLGPHIHYCYFIRVTGKVVWFKETEMGNESYDRGSLCRYDDILLVQTYSGMAALDAISGETIWEKEKYFFAPEWVEQNGILYFSHISYGELYAAIDIAGGKKVWDMPVSSNYFHITFFDNTSVCILYDNISLAAPTTQLNFSKYNLFVAIKSYIIIGGQRLNNNP